MSNPFEEKPVLHFAISNLGDKASHIFDDLVKKEKQFAKKEKLDELKKIIEMEISSSKEMMDLFYSFEKIEEFFNSWTISILNRIGSE